VSVTSKKLEIMAEYKLSGRSLDCLARRKEIKFHWEKKREFLCSYWIGLLIS